MVRSNCQELGNIGVVQVRICNHEIQKKQDLELNDVQGVPAFLWNAGTPADMAIYG